MANQLRLSLAVSDYDHVRDLTSGRIRVDGADLIPLTMPVEEIFYRFIHHREWDVSELSFAKYAAMTASGDADFTAIPVFPSRMFRISSVYVRTDSALTRPEELAGKRVGLPEWAQTAAVYTRGWLSETIGIDLRSIAWFQAGVNQPGRAEKVKLALPEGIRLTPVPDKSLTQMLLAGEVDAVFSAHPPAPFQSVTGGIRQLVADTRAAEEAYFKATGIFPIMHVIAIRNQVLAAAPWIAQNLYKAFGAARASSLARLRELTASRFPLPWAAAHAANAEQLFGDLFPYGVEANRTTLSAFLRFAHDQGLTGNRLAPDSIFAPATLGSFKI